MFIVCLENGKILYLTNSEKHGMLRGGSTLFFKNIPNEIEGIDKYANTLNRSQRKIISGARDQDVSKMK